MLCLITRYHSKHLYLSSLSLSLTPLFLSLSLSLSLSLFVPLSLSLSNYRVFPSHAAQYSIVPDNLLICWLLSRGQRAECLRWQHICRTYLHVNISGEKICNIWHQKDFQKQHSKLVLYVRNFTTGSYVSYYSYWTWHFVVLL